MFLFKKRKKVIKTPIKSLFHLNDFVDFWHKDDVYFGKISDIKLDEKSHVIYDNNWIKQDEFVPFNT